MSNGPASSSTGRADSPSGPVTAEAATYERFMQIGEVATRTELSLRSLRHWEEVGLLKPSARSEGGFRLYSEADVDKVLVIRRMKPLGFTLDQMKAVMGDLDILEDAGSDSDAVRAARQRLSDIGHDALSRREHLARQLDMADEFIHLLSTRQG